MKPDDIAFIDETVYAPHSQTKPPYKMKIDSLLPLLGDRVKPLLFSAPLEALTLRKCCPRAPWQGLQRAQRLRCVAATHLQKALTPNGI